MPKADSVTDRALVVRHHLLQLVLAGEPDNALVDKPKLRIVALCEFDVTAMPARFNTLVLGQVRKDVIHASFPLLSIHSAYVAGLPSMYFSPLPVRNFSTRLMR